MSHEAICPWNLKCNFCPKKYYRFQLGCQTYATCFATCNEIIFYPRRVFKNVSGILIMSYCDWFLLKKIAGHVAVGVSHATTSRVALRKVEAASSFSAIWNPIFRSETSCKLWWVTLGSLSCHKRKSCNLQWNAICVATCKENCLVWHGLKPSVSRVETSVKFVMSWITCMYILSPVFQWCFFLRTFT